VGAVITATKGPVNELTEVTTVEDLKKIFGDVTADHLGMICAEAHFDLGNIRLFLVRAGVADEGITGHLAKATVTLQDQTTPTPVDLMSLTLKEYGTFGNDFTVKVSNVPELGGAATLEIYRAGVKQSTYAVSWDESSSNYVSKALAADGFVDCTILETGVTDAKLKAGEFTFAGGDDGVVEDAAAMAAAYVGEYDEVADTYTGAQALLQRTDTINLLATYGYTAASYITALKTIAAARMDCMVIVDTPSGKTSTEAVTWADENSISGWQVYILWDWQKRVVGSTLMDVPPSGYFTSKIAYNDMLYGFWLPVAGLTRGIVNSVGCVKSPTIAQADSLVAAHINPIIDMGRQGIVIWGNETRNTTDSDLSAFHVARTLLYCIDSIKRSSRSVMFELNNSGTWHRWKNAVGNFLQSLVARGALHSYKVAMGTETMTQQDIQDRVMKGTVSLQFYMDGEVINVEFVVEASGL